MSLPPLPTPACTTYLDVECVEVATRFYKAEQMQSYGQQCREAALLEAALLCNAGQDWSEQWMMSEKKSIDYIKAFNEGCTDCEALIRRLK
jgi:hypothetical protein